MASVSKYFKSTDVKVYPSSKRVDYHDRNARLNSEQNLVSVVNRLTNRNSFVIDGLSIDEDNKVLKSGSCNIHGYLFNLQNDVDISDIAGDETNCYLYLNIETQDTTINTVSNTTKYTELVSLDTQIIKDTSTDTAAITGALDGSTSADSTFTGLQLVTGPDYSNTNYCVSQLDEGVKYWYLPIAKWKINDTAVNSSNNWENLLADDSIQDESVSRWNTLRADTNTIRIQADSSNVANNYYSNQQDLSTWLQYNFIIDDGEID